MAAMVLKDFICVVALVGSVGLTAGSRAADQPADLVLLHGKIHTQDASRRVVEALAVRGNTIVNVGSDTDISALVGPDTRSVDLGGRVVLPGIIDAHIHPADGARDLDSCNLGTIPISATELRNRLIKCLKENPGDPKLWFRAINVDPVGLSLTRNDLDSILTDRPMVIFANGGHTVWVNSAALTAAHITAATKEPVGGRIERDARGIPTGTLQDAAFDIVERAMPKADLDLEAAQLKRAFDAMHARGITSVQDASVDEHLMQMYKRLYDTHRLSMRVRASYTLENLHTPAETLIARAIAFRTKWTIDTDFLRADAVKIFADGVIEYPTQTAALLEPYLDATGRPSHNRGPSYFTQQNLNSIVAAADAAGFTVHIHAIGDRAVRSALDAFAYSRKLNGPSDNRDQIAHLELVETGDFPRFQALGVIANLQLDWAERDDFIVKGTIPYIGTARAQYLYPARSLRDAGALIAGGSDWGDSFDAFEAMEHAITRSKGRGQKPLLPEQSIGLQDMVDAYTINAAFALKQERTTGSLEPGKRGDFIVLDRDIFAVDPFDIHNTQVLAAYLDGREVYKSKLQ
jgi:predicted amidohydrolase YtcJ